MSSIIMTTILAGQMMGTATFGSMDECTSARNKVMEQSVPGMQVICMYEDKKNTWSWGQFPHPKDPKFEDCMDYLLDMKEICNTGATINCGPYYKRLAHCTGSFILSDDPWDLLQPDRFSKF